MSTEIAHLDPHRWSRLARHLAAQADRSTAGQAIAEAALDVVGCTSAAVVHAVGDKHRLQFQVPGAGPDHYVTKIAAIVAEVGESPALDALRSGEVTIVEDLLIETRWPEYAARVSAVTRLRSIMVFPLQLGEQVLGVLPFYDVSPGFFDAAHRDVAEVYADYAAVALARAEAAERAGNLALAVASNRIIGQAIGILMTRYGLRDCDAFDVLRLASQASQLKVRDIADDVVREGDLPSALGPARPRA